MVNHEICFICSNCGESVEVTRIGGLLLPSYIPPQALFLR
jgi:hypothetical protein